MKFKWIQGKRNEKNITLGIRKEFIFYSQTKLLIAAIQVYRLFIDNKFVGYGPARTALGNVRIDEYIVSPGKHIISVEIASYRINTYYLINEPPFIGIQAINDTQSFDIDDFSAYLLNDRVKVVQRYSYQRDFIEIYHQSQCRSCFYSGESVKYPEVKLAEVKGSNIINRNVSYVPLENYSDIQLIEKGTFSYDPTLPVWDDRCLYTSKIFLGYDYSLVKEKPTDYCSRLVYTARNIVKLKANNYFLYEFKESKTGFINIELIVEKKATFYILWDELIHFEQESSRYLNGARNINFSRQDCSQVIKYTLRKGHYNLLSFEPYLVKYLKILVCVGTINVQNIGFILYENSDVKLEYKVEEPKIGAIIDACLNTFKENAVDVLTDCPSRERAGWLCDSYFSGQAEFILTGTNKVERNFLENYAISQQIKQLPKGMIPMCYPADHYNNEFIPNWSMWYILELYNYYLRNDDKELLNMSIPKVVGLLKYFKKFENEFGLLENLESWVFVEWSKANDPEFLKGVSFPTNMTYAKVLEVASIMLNKPKLLVKSKALKKVINRLSYNGQFYVDNAVRIDGKLTPTKNITETCQYYALFFKTPNGTNYKKLFTLMKDSFGPNRKEAYKNVYKSNAFIGNYLRLQVLFENHEADKIYSELIDYLFYMANRTQTLWEHDSAHASCCHGFASYAIKWIIYCYTGITNIYLDGHFDIDDKVIKKDIHLKIPNAGHTLYINVENGILFSNYN
jgi:alpha-L-rhamnosidase